FGDLSPTSASAHMNYLIKLLKSCFAAAVIKTILQTVELACLSKEGVFYALPGGCQGRCCRCELTNISNRLLSKKR
ncbi:hypothetical protein QT231_22105, partial [Halomonas sp. SpR1]|uniref:hypothetical protein n=1 Tax=Halomonas sp. SpR1 TaxID=3050462 RepID=UPI0027E52CFB